MIGRVIVGLALVSLALILSALDEPYENTAACWEASRYGDC